VITNYYTLLALSHEWSGQLERARLADAYSGSRDELSLVFDDGSEQRTLRLSARPGATFAFLTDRAGRPRRNVRTLFEEVIGLRVDRVALADRDRFLFFHLDDEWLIIFKPFGPRPNVLLVRELPVATVVRALSSEALLVDKPPQPTRPAAKITSFEEFRNAWSAAAGDRAGKRLRRLYPLLAQPVVHEAVFRARVERDSPDLAEGVLETLHDCVRNIEAELSNPRARLYTARDGSLQLSLIELTHLADSHVDFFDSTNAAVAACVRTGLRSRAIADLRDPLLKAIRRELRRVRSNLLQIDTAEKAVARADEYEKWGHLLMAHASIIEMGVAQVSLPDLMEGGNPLDIPMKPELSAIKNATRYYEKAGRLRRELDRIPQRKEDLENRLTALEDALAATEAASDVSELRQLKQRVLVRLGLSFETSGQSETQPFRRFRVTGGFEVLVGRNARENELLTWQTAAKHDLWFHARGVSGSHVVLRLGSRGARVPRRAREEAAAIAAYYSKAKSSGLVPVHMAERKYLARARGAELGKVRLLREEVLLVEPGLPKMVSLPSSGMIERE
jgi:predicted ribosome quality control (RQC) complex YloA/Tae2 family protein